MMDFCMAATTFNNVGQRYSESNCFWFVTERLVACVAVVAVVVLWLRYHARE